MTNSRSTSQVNLRLFVKELHERKQNIKLRQYPFLGNIYSFGGIMYEIVTAQRPFADQVHDTYLIIDICNGVRPKVHDFMLNWIQKCADPSAAELVDLFSEISYKLYRNIIESNNVRQLEIADENQKKNTTKSQKQLFSHSRIKSGNLRVYS
ncbi:hypothetical protein Glove_84g5 [Diversispora epigaea]|uniref:Protein kinase domain-containing protein n=1 Tax=Diversispora epigaea TaxID=1348612 RepID=A0A397JEA2_9GLOM|nr:hypothetical protein Glove_84g5 [Diversispora epigaea]